MAIVGRIGYKHLMSADSDPLTWSIETELKGREYATLWGSFDPPENMRMSLLWATGLCWNIYAHDGGTLADLLDAECRRAYLSHQQTLKNLEKLDELGIIVVVPGKITLRRTIACPLERLAACAD